MIGQIRDQLRKRVRRDMGRSPGAVATIIDSQSVKAAETVGKDSRGYDVAKKINGRSGTSSWTRKACRCSSWSPQPT